MTQASDSVSGSVTDFTYSGGLRIGGETITGEDTASEVFQWDTLAGVPLLLADSGHEYIYGVGSAPVAQVDTTTGVVEFLHGDLIGSTRAVTDSSGVVVGAWDYSMFGVVMTATGGASGDGVGVTRFLFAGEYLDDTGFYYLRARFYDPVTASFVSVDPALARTGSPYAYASGNPLQLVDPLGLWSLRDPRAAVASLAAGPVRGELPGQGCQTSGGFFAGGYRPDADDLWGAASSTAANAGMSFLGNYNKIFANLWRQGSSVGARAIGVLRKAPWLRHTVRVGGRFGTNLALGSLDGVMAAATAADNYFFRYDGVENQSDRIQFTVERTLVTEVPGAVVGAYTDKLAVAVCVESLGALCAPAVVGSAIVQTGVSEGSGVLYDWLNEGRVAAASGDQSRRRRFMLSDQSWWPW